MLLSVTIKISTQDPKRKSSIEISFLSTIHDIMTVSNIEPASIWSIPS